MWMSCQIQSGLNEKEVFLYTFDKHTPESHSADHSARGLKLLQQAAVQATVRVHPMASSTDVRRNLNLADKKRRDEVYISPAKKRTVQREVAKERRKVLSEFTGGESIDRSEGSARQSYPHVRQDLHTEIGC